MDNLKRYFQIYGTLNKYIVYNFVLRNLKLKYRKSILGVFWTILIPAFTATIYFFVFNFVLKVKIENYLLFVLTGLIPWTFFSGAFQQAVESIVGNQNILNKVPVPMFIFPYSEVLTHLINLALSIPAIIVVYLIYRVSPSWAILQVFPLLGLLFLQTYAFGLIGSILFVYLRDLRFIIGIVLQAWFYMTPILYELEMIPDPFKPIIYANPIGSIFHGLHEAVMYNHWMSRDHVLSALLWTLGMVLISNYIYFRNSKSLVENL